MRVRVMTTKMMTTMTMMTNRKKTKQMRVGCGGFNRVKKQKEACNTL